MNYKELINKLNSYTFNKGLVLIYFKKEIFANSQLYAKGNDIKELSSNLVDAITKKGTKGIFQIVEI